MKSSALTRLPFLQGLPPKTIAAVNRVLRPVSVAAGTQLFRTGDQGDACYFVERGALTVTNVPDGDELATLGPGAFVGELALLLNEPRTATVTATRPTDLWELTRDDLNELIEEHPELALAITRELGRRIVYANNRLVGDFGPHRSVVWPAPAAARLAAAVAERGHGVGLMAMPGVRVTTPPGVTRLRSASSDARGITSTIVAASDDAPSSAGRKAVANADHVLVFGEPPRWLRELARPNRLVHVPGGTLGMRRAVRWATGRAVGLVLSSGGAKTVAHLGVISVLRGAGVEIDAVAGSSGGAIGAMGVAFGKDDAFLRNCVADIARTTRLRSMDFNLPPRSGLFKGKKLVSLFEHWGEKQTFADAEIPAWVVATDVANGREVVLHEGPIADAMRASMSIPGAFDPWRIGDHVLIDGAVVNPLPTRVLRDAGVGVVIASNVAGQATDIPVADRTPSLGQVMGRMLNALERGIITAELPLADVVVRPVVSVASSFDFSDADGMIAIGAQAAEAKIDDIRKLLRAASDLTSSYDAAAHHR